MPLSFWLPASIFPKRADFPYIRLRRLFARQWQVHINWHSRTYRTADSRFSWVSNTLFFIAELTLDDPECVLHFTAHRGLAVLNISFTADCIIRNMRLLLKTAVNAVVNAAACVISRAFAAVTVMICTTRYRHPHQCGMSFRTASVIKSMTVNFRIASLSYMASSVSWADRLNQIWSRYIRSIFSIPMGGRPRFSFG